MARVKMNRELTSDLEKCSKVITKKNKSLIKGAVALIVAAALVSVPISVVGAEEIRIQGIPPWLEGAAERSLERVWREMSQGGRSLESRLELLELVSKRLFDGYSVQKPRSSRSGIIVQFEPEDFPEWSVEIIQPSLNNPAKRWFNRDTAGLEQELGATVKSLPLGSLSWTDVSLREEIDRICGDRVAGWKPSILVNLSGSEAILQVRFNPEQPLVLAVRPEVSSSSLPVILRSDLRDSLVREMYVFTGLPLEWLEDHQKDLELYARNFLLDRNTVSNARADVAVTVDPGPISNLKAEVESHRYSVSAKLVIPIGADLRYPELQLHLGRIAQPFGGWDLEIYGEFITEANDLDIESRWGAGWKPWNELWIGAEYTLPEDLLWWKAVYRPKIDGFYLWGRYSEEDSGIIGAGVPVNQYFSIELYYDERYEDSFCIRLVTEL